MWQPFVVKARGRKFEWHQPKAQRAFIWFELETVGGDLSTDHSCTYEGIWEAWGGGGAKEPLRNKINFTIGNLVMKIVVV